LGSIVFQRVLIICVGNICRSPTAEYLLRQRLPAGAANIVSSAGLGALVGRPVETTAAEILREQGIDCSGHQARQLTVEMLRQSDLILTMEKPHVAAIGRIAPEVSGRVFLLGKWQSDISIPDPYGRQRPAYDHAYGLIDQAVSSWLPYLL
jgi:protein-tyrosine phosphatase